jgi:hypothetical protein
MPFRCDLYDDPFTPTFRLDDIVIYLRAKLPTVTFVPHGELVREKLAAIG